MINAKIAEVEVLRSFFYYLLIDNYGDVPYVISTTKLHRRFQPSKVDREIIYDSLIYTVEKNLQYLKTSNLKYMATRNMAFASIG